MNDCMDFIDQLYSNIIGGSSPFDGIILDKIDEKERKYTDEIDAILTKHKFSIDEINDFSSLTSEYAVHSERRGFKEGFNLGARFAKEAFNDK